MLMFFGQSDADGEDMKSIEERCQTELLAWMILCFLFVVAILFHVAKLWNKAPNPSKSITLVFACFATFTIELFDWNLNQSL